MCPTSRDNRHLNPKTGGEPPPPSRSHPTNTKKMRGSVPGKKKQQTLLSSPDTLPRKKVSGSVLLSHTLPHAVPSALKGLASGFGMRPGVSLSP